MAITRMHGIRMGRGMVVLDNPLGLENKGPLSKDPFLDIRGPYF